MRHWGIWLLITVSLVGCATYSVDDLDYSLSDIQKAVGENLVGGVARVSSNQREFESAYFKPEQFQQKPAKPSGEMFVERAYAKVYVLGDRRPYSLEVVVQIQEKDLSDANYSTPNWSDIHSGVFYDTRKDRDLANRIGRGIHDYLVKRGRKKNLIDDFKPF